MEYLPGKSLADLVLQHGPLAPERVVALLEQTCEALSEAHRLGLIHRDIKPGNIFAAERGGVYDVAKLLDFGLAKPIINSGDINLTQEGSITGSPLFMAPEQATGDGIPDARSDIYALGAVAFYLLTGRPPFEADNAVKILLAHAQKPVVPPSKLQAGIPDDLDRIVLRCLEKTPADRFATVNDLSAALTKTSLHGKWTRDMAQRWWQTNGGVDGEVVLVGSATDRTNTDPTVIVASSTKGSSDATSIGRTLDGVSAPTSALVG
jgi:serine/threonine-protein kinase